MHIRFLALPATVAVLASLAVTLAPSASQAATTRATPAPDCTYTPVLPKRVVVNKASVTFHTPVRIGGGSACASTFSAQEPLTRKSDSYTLSWQYNSRTSTDIAYAVTIRPGTYHALGGTNCVADVSQDMTCAVEPGSTVIKFGGKAHLSGKRLTGKKADRVRFTARATHYAQYTTTYITTRVSIQRRVSGKWHTVHSAIAHGKKGYVWTAKDASSATYRAVSHQSSTTFAATSGTLTR